MALIYEELSNLISSAAFAVHSSIGCGLLESVYQAAFEIELNHVGVPFQAQQPLKVYHRNKLAGEFYADIVVDQKIILELKAVDSVTQTG